MHYNRLSRATKMIKKLVWIQLKSKNIRTGEAKDGGSGQGEVRLAHQIPECCNERTPLEGRKKEVVLVPIKDNSMSLLRG